MTGYIPEFAPDLSCPVCHEPFIVTGETPIARERALRDWSCCPVVLTLSPEDFDTLTDALDAPPEVRERLRAALEEYGEQVDPKHPRPDGGPSDRGDRPGGGWRHALLWAAIALWFVLAAGYCWLVAGA